MFSRLGSAAFKKDLTNIKILCKLLEDPHKKFKSIHVGGTNGKGSVSHMLAAVLQTQGYKTGLYTSPHLYDFRERIKINGKMVDEDFVIGFVERITPLIEKIEPSFFEITVAMAFEYFAQQKVDVAIIEVGLGGRLDSTNIITPELSVITNIGWDHMNMLGDTLEKISFEKAGIIKENIPVVIGEMQKETDEIFCGIADENNSPIYFAEDVFQVSSYQLDEQQLKVDVHDNTDNSIHQYSIDLPGIYQTKNLCPSLAVIKLLKQNGWDISFTAIKNGLQNVKQLTGLHGRWEIIHQHPNIVLEVAHNRNGIEQMLQHIDQLSFNELHLIIGMVKDKEIENVLKLLPTNAHYYFTQANIPRAMPAVELQQKAVILNLHGQTFDNVNNALQDALRNASENDLIIICGSIFLVAEVNKQLTNSTLPNDRVHT